MPSIKLNGPTAQTLLLKTPTEEATVVLTVNAPDNITDLIGERYQKTGNSPYDLAQWMVGKNWAVLGVSHPVILKREVTNLQITTRRPEEGDVK